MKSIGNALRFMVLPLLLMVAVVGCGKKSNNNNTVGYGIVNGQCYQNGTSTITNMSYCQGSGQYQMIGNQCVVTGTQQVVDQSLCYNNGGYGGGYNGGYGGGYNGGYGGGYNGGYGGGYNGGYGGGYNGGYGGGYNGGYGSSQTCYGQYYASNGYTASGPVFCNGYNCSGYFLYSYQTRSSVYCQ